MAARTRSRLLWLVALAVVGCCACAALRSRQHPADSPVATTRPTTAPSGALLSITITDLRNHKGDLVFGVFTQSDGFPNVQAKSVYWEVKPADADRVTFTT